MTDWRDKVAFLNLASYTGIVAGACHYYASIKFGDDDSIDLVHALSRREAVVMNKSDGKGLDDSFCWSPGDELSRYNSKEDAIKVAKEKWRELAPDAKVLIKGEHYVAQPQLVLDGPSPEIVDKLNALYQRCEDLDWWDGGNDDKVEATYEEWKKILINETG